MANFISHLYHLRQLRKFRVSLGILKNFYSGAIESVLTQCISVWYGNSSNQDGKALTAKGVLYGETVCVCDILALSLSLFPYVHTSSYLTTPNLIRER